MEVAISVVTADLGGVIPALLTGRVALQAGGVGDAELPAEVGDDAQWDLGGVGQEGPQEPHGPELHGESEPVVIPSVPIDQTAIRVVEMKVASQLPGRRLTGVPAVAALLLPGQEVDGHPGPFPRSSPGLGAGCQIGSPARGARGSGRIIGFPGPIHGDKMGRPFLSIRPLWANRPSGDPYGCGCIRPPRGSMVHRDAVPG